MAQKKRDLRSRIVALLEKQKATAPTESEIASTLNVRGGEKKSLQRLLRSMVTSGDIVLIRQNRYAVGDSADLLAGKLTVLRSGNGFVDAPEGSVFVFSRDQGLAFPGDRVLVRLHSEAETEPGRDRTGKIIRILERSRHDIVGTLRSTGKFFYVVPMDPSYTHDIYVPDKAGAKIGDRVICRFLNWEHRHVNPEGEVLETLGASNDPSKDTISIIKHYGLPEEFPPEVVREAQRVSELMEKPGERLDLRDAYIITIDPETARDFDDALSLETRSDGTRVLGVHIADVSHFVTPNSLLDREAAERGNSVYLPDQVIPMLPEQLSNGVCSLKPREDRLAFSVFITIDRSGKCLESGFARTTIHSKQRLTYEEAMASLSGKKSGQTREIPARTRKLLEQLNALAQELRQGRFANYALDLDMPECQILMGARGKIKDIRLVDNDVSHQLVEECMIAANEAIARELSARRAPLISRLHEPPEQRKLEALHVELESMGHHPGNLSQPKVLAKFLDKMKEDPLSARIQLSILRSMNRAVYSADKAGHYGLAKTHYAHFTSPIRRYPDLLVHRQLGHLLKSGAVRGPGPRSGQGGEAKSRLAYSREALKPLADACTATEQKADEAERTLKEIKKYRFLEQQLRTRKVDDFEAVVVSVMNYGMYVELPRLQLQGLIHISAISNKFVRFDRGSQSLRAGKKTYRVGTNLKVRPAKVDFDKRQIDFMLVK
jgi:ribonuclease R